MLFSMKELLKWFGVTHFEIFMQLIAWLIFSVLFVLKMDHIMDDSLSWWTIYACLFVCDAFTCYFNVIVYIRQFMEAKYKIAFLRATWSFTQIALLFTAKLLLCYKLEQQKQVSNFEIISPMFIYLVMLLIRACQLH